MRGHHDAPNGVTRPSDTHRSSLLDAHENPFSNGSVAAASKTGAKLLVAHADAATADGLAEDLRRHSFDAVAVTSGITALRAYDDVDLILLDLGLRDMDGLAVCRQIRQDSDTPIIAFTETRNEVDRVLGLQAGADHCLDELCGFRELTARIDALLRRVHSSGVNMPQQLVRGDLHIHATTRQVFVANCPVELTRKEFDLLYLLASQPGVVLSRQQLMAELWDDPMTHSAGTRVSRTIDTHVSALRRKLGSAHWIYTVRSVGFCFTSRRPCDASHSS